MKYSLEDKFKIAVLVIFLLLDTCYLWDMIYGAYLFLSYPAESGDPPKAVWPIVITHALLVMSITAAGFVRIKRGKKKVIITGLLMKLLTCWIGFGVIALPMGEVGIAILFILTGLLLASTPFLASYHNSHKPVRPAYNLEPYKFDSIKAKYSWDSAALEYCRINNRNIAELTEEECDEIYDYAGMDVTYLIIWLAKNDFLSDIAYANGLADQIKEMTQENADPSNLFACFDYVLSQDDMSEEILPFISSYYYLHEYPFRQSGCYEYGHGSYLNHYYETIRNPEHRLYCIDFSWETYRKLEKKIDESYKYYLREYEECNEYPDGEWKWDRLGAKLTVVTAYGVTDEYIQSCINALNSLSEAAIDDICDRLVGAFDALFDYIPKLEQDKRKVFDYFTPDQMTINAPCGNEPAFIIGGEGELDPEHGIAFSMRGGIILNAGYRADLESDNVWNRDNELTYLTAKYAIDLDIANIDSEKKVKELVGAGKLQKVPLVPEAFAGNAAVGDSLYLPPTAAEYKRNCDIMIEYLMLNGIPASDYSCELSYREKCIIPYKLYITAVSETDTVFSQTLKVW